MKLLLFLIQVFIISFSGAAQPGPVTATAITMGARNRWAGVLLAIGHGIVEFPFMILIMLGVGAIFKHTTTQIITGLAGGAILIYMAYGMFKSARAESVTQDPARKDKPILAGVILTVGNPYFLIWWATVGLALATTAREFGIWAFALFSLVHWLVDLLWVGALSLASFHGKTLLGSKRQQIVLKICALAMLFFGLFFVYTAAATVVRKL